MLGQNKQRAPKLLRTVKNQPWASQNDHHDALPTPAPSHSTRSSGSNGRIEDVEDVSRDPESSDDEQRKHFKPALHTPPLFSPESKPEFRLAQHDGTVDAKSESSAAFKPLAISPESTLSKRSAGSDGPSSDSDGLIFSSQGSSKRPKGTTYGGNIHAKPQTYLSKNQKKAALLKSQAEARRLRSPAHKAKRREASPEAPTFKVATVPDDVFRFGKESVTAGFKQARTSGDGLPDVDADGFASLSSPLSELSSPPSSPDVEVIESLDLPDVSQYKPTVDCEICGAQVELFLKQDFEDEFNRSKLLTYKWQQRFCRHHKKHDAKQVWHQRGYPEIDWDNLDKRLAARRHMKHLKRVICGETHSVYAEQLQEQLKSRSKTAMQSINDEGGKKTAAVGYYGPRGGKLM